MSPNDEAASWDAEYTSRRYLREPPIDFVPDILAAAGDAELIGREGLYIGCGNGRNYLPLIAGGLDLVGLDVSAIALQQLAERAPERRHRLVHGDLGALPHGKTYPILIGIQVFQHGDRVRAHAHIKAAQTRLAARGLFCLRVNAVGTDVAPEHEITERHGDEGFTVRYLAGPRRACRSTSSARRNYLSFSRPSSSRCFRYVCNVRGATPRVEASGRSGRPSGARCE